MKKFTSILMLLTFAFVAFAQERVAIPMDKIDMQGFSFTKANDTLAPPSFFNPDVALTYYITVEEGTTDTGYVCGTNYYGDVAKAQQFLFDTPYNLIGCLAWVAQKAGSTGDVIFNVYNSNGNGENNTGPVTYAPGTVLSTATKPFSQIVAGLSFAEGSNYFELPTPLAITSDYYVGLNFSQMGPFPANKLGLVSSTDGDATGTDLSWEQWNDNSWYSLLMAWPLDFDIMFFPIVTTDGTNIQESYINNVMINMYPNPVVDKATVQFELKSDAKNVYLTIHDITGKGIKNIDLGSKSAGSHSVKIDLTDLSAGTYIYSLQADRNRLAKKFNIE